MCAVVGWILASDKLSEPLRNVISPKRRYLTMTVINYNCSFALNALSTPFKWFRLEIFLEIVSWGHVKSSFQFSLYNYSTRNKLCTFQFNINWESKTFSSFELNTIRIYCKAFEINVWWQYQKTFNLKCSSEKLFFGQKFWLKTILKPRNSNDYDWRWFQINYLQLICLNWFLIMDRVYEHWWSCQHESIRPNLIMKQT